MADKGDSDLIRICSLTVQKMSLSIAAVGEIFAFKVANLTMVRTHHPSLGHLFRTVQDNLVNI
jgi:hypothetical protein